MSGIRLLIVESSRFFREMFAAEIVKYLPPNSEIEKVSDASEARFYIKKAMPNAMIISAQLPGMSGLEFLQEVRSNSFTKILFSTVEEDRELAMNAGADWFMLKPAGLFSIGSEFYEDISRKIVEKPKPKPVFTTKPPSDIAPVIKKPSVPIAPVVSNVSNAPKVSVNSWCRLVAIGSSTGGTEAVTKLLMRLRAPMPPICIVQHITPAFSKLFAARLDRESVLSVSEAVTGDVLANNHVYIAPGNKHMTLEKKNGVLTLKCEAGPRVHGVLSSADVFFDSVVPILKNEICGVILTGMGADGAAGLLKIRQAGGRTLGQDEASCVVYGMPKAAFNLGAVEKQVSIDNMADELTRLVRG